MVRLGFGRRQGQLRASQGRLSRLELEERLDFALVLFLGLSYLVFVHGLYMYHCDVDLNRL